MPVGEVVVELTMSLVFGNRHENEWRICCHRSLVALHLTDAPERSYSWRHTPRGAFAHHHRCELRGVHITTYFSIGVQPERQHSCVGAHEVGDRREHGPEQVVDIHIGRGGAHGDVGVVVGMGLVGVDYLLYNRYTRGALGGDRIGALGDDEVLGAFGSGGMAMSAGDGVRGALVGSRLVAIGSSKALGALSGGVIGALGGDEVAGSGLVALGGSRALGALSGGRVGVLGGGDALGGFDGDPVGSCASLGDLGIGCLYEVGGDRMCGGLERALFGEVCDALGALCIWWPEEIGGDRLCAGLEGVVSGDVALLLVALDRRGHLVDGGGARVSLVRAARDEVAANAFHRRTCVELARRRQWRALGHLQVHESYVAIRHGIYGGVRYLTPRRRGDEAMRR